MLTLLHRPPAQTTTISTSFSFFAAASTPPLPPPPRPLDASIAASILAATPQTLPGILQDPTIQWTPDLVDKTLKRLWNHAPKALSFFAHLSRRRPGYAPLPPPLTTPSTSLCASATSGTHGPSAPPRRRSPSSPRGVLVDARARLPSGFELLSSFNTILDILCKSRHVEMASNKLFKVFGGRFKADCVSYNIIANRWCLIKRTPMALEVLKEMVDRGLTPTSTTYNIMLKGFFRAGQKRKCDIDVVTYTTVINGFGIDGEIKEAKRVFGEMSREGILPSVATYNAMIQVLYRKDNVENAILVFEVLRKGYVPNSITYNLVIRGPCHAGHMDRAVE
ncbi:hypothetical protein ACJRO7_009486 [Eucalyptus globulus]|uniref:Pentatricopeptide repeat-containing protein n=1 Tax=Eucalyptus globulus TaxID=34317 RepID=A0ABD3L913_EUCGL